MLQSDRNVEPAVQRLWPTHTATGSQCNNTVRTVFKTLEHLGGSRGGFQSHA